MIKAKLFIPFIVIGMFVYGCGPDTVFLRPALDTPAQHVANGHQLLNLGKFDDACREFDRAKELDPNFIGAYVGLGVALGKKGDVEAGLQSLDMAKEMADSTEDIESIQKGYDQLNEMKQMRP